MKEMIEKAEKHLLHTYNRYQIVLDHGEGVYLYDTDGKKYLDFGSGIGVCALGYGDEELCDAIKNQVDKLLHTSNLFYTEPLVNAATKLCEITGMDRVFMTNSGTEAIEGALKLARKYALKKGYHNRTEIVSMNKAFHGRSMGALSVTGTEKYRSPFEPLISGVTFATYNDLESVKAAVSDKTCAIIMETLQGEGGIYKADSEFIKGVRQLCDEHDMIMICDEIQCGMGRTGTFFAYEQYGIKPDVVTMAKGIGSGVPVGAFAMNEKAMIGLEAGDHGTTFGGNPLVMTAVSKTIDIFRNRNIVDHVKVVGAYLSDQLDQLMARKDVIVDHRGNGLMQGIECKEAVASYIGKAMEQGVILMSAGANVIRILPPLVIEKEHVDELIRVLDEILE